MTLVEAGPFRPQAARRPIWLPAFYIDVAAVTRAEFDRFRAATAEPLEDAWDLGAWLDGEPDHPSDAEPVVPIRRMRNERRRPGRKDITAPLTGVSREEAGAYATWAAKWLPTVDEWDRAHQNPHGVISSGVAEWCAGQVGLVRRGRARERTGFRCSTPLGPDADPARHLTGPRSASPAVSWTVSRCARAVGTRKDSSGGRRPPVLSTVVNCPK